MRLGRVLALLWDAAAVRAADRMMLSQGAGALEMARHAVRAAGERHRGCYWSRVLAVVERRTNYRPW